MRLSIIASFFLVANLQSCLTDNFLHKHLYLFGSGDLRLAHFPMSVPRVVIQVPPCYFYGERVSPLRAFPVEALQRVDGGMLLKTVVGIKPRSRLEALPFPPTQPSDPTATLLRPRPRPVLKNQITSCLLDWSRHVT